MKNLVLGGFEGRLFFALLLSFALSISLTDRQAKDRSSSLLSGAVLNSWDLPILMGLLLVLSFFLEGIASTVRIIVPSFFSITIYISIYYALLISFTSVLRKYISPASTTVLWMIPNYLYFAFFAPGLFEKPLFSVKINKTFSDFLPWIYAAGFLAFLIFKITSHIIFRHNILKNSFLIEDEAILKVLEEEKEETGLAGLNINIYNSSKIKTPVSIGLFKRTVFVVLPSYSYSIDELHLIFRHELVHISRKDSLNKFFIVFCQALCWFNPLIYAAMKKCSEDIEMNCDELTMRGENLQRRKDYAALILNSSGDERGFSSCLSASAKSLKLRLKNILDPKKRYIGSSLAAFMMFLLIMAGGSFTFAMEKGTAEEYLYTDDGRFLNSVSVYNEDTSPKERYMIYPLKDADALEDYLSKIKLYKYTDLYRYENNDVDYKFAFNYFDGEKLLGLTLYPEFLHIKYPEGSELAGEYLIFDEEIDKNTVLGFLDTKGRAVSAF